MVAVAVNHQVEWSPLATIPERRATSVLLPLIGTGNLSELRGRSGDLIIVQLKSAERETPSRQGSIRTLGLRGPNSASLRNSSDPTIWGYIAAVRDLIGVIELDEVKWKAATVDARDAGVAYEVIAYGSNTQPGAMVHNTLGDYFVWESTRRNLLVSWTTGLSPAECLRELENCFETLTPQPAGDASVVGLAAEPTPLDVIEVTDDTVDESIQVLDLSTVEAIDIVRSGADLALVRLSFDEVEMVWREPYVRFLGDDEALAEVSLFAYGLSFVPRARVFARATANRGFFTGRDFEVMVREHGNAKRLRF